MSPRADHHKIQFVCQTCGHVSPKWLGRCPDCGGWNQLVEELIRPASQTAAASHRRTAEGPLPLVQLVSEDSPRYFTRIPELDTVLGGGIVPGSLILVGGDPGIGKSTLLLQTAFQLAQQKLRVLYISGEESPRQIKLRADRISPPPPDLFIAGETDVTAILEQVRQSQPAVVIVDSIQTLMHPEISSAPGSVGQVRECGSVLMNLAKTNGPAVFIVGHVTKEGTLAGPRVLEHMVDTVLYFEGDRQHGYRILRTAKNRFGSTNEIGVFEMGPNGLTGVGDPSRLFLSERRSGASGSVVTVSLEGTRPILVEIQSLVAPSYFGMPQRRVSGLDYNRCCLLLAVLERRGGILMGSQDVFFSVVGGLSLEEPAIDLALVAAVASSAKDKAVDPETVILGEVGLGGEIRAVSQPEKRLQAAAQLGFKRCVLPRKNLEKMHGESGLECLGAEDLAAAFKLVF